MPGVDSLKNSLSVPCIGSLPMRFVEFKQSGTSPTKYRLELNIKEAEELVKIAKENDKILMVGHLLHYHPCIEKIKSMIAENKIGKIKSITSNRLSLGIFRKYETDYMKMLLYFLSNHFVVILVQLMVEVLSNAFLHGKGLLTSFLVMLNLLAVVVFFQFGNCWQY